MHLQQWHQVFALGLPLMLMPLKWCGSAVPKGIITSLHLRISSSDWPLSCNLICRMGVRLTKCQAGSPPLSNHFSLWKILSLSCRRQWKKYWYGFSPLFSLRGSPAETLHPQGPQSRLSTAHEEQARREAKKHEVASCSRKTCVRICEK